MVDTESYNGRDTESCTRIAIAYMRAMSPTVKLPNGCPGALVWPLLPLGFAGREASRAQLPRVPAHPRVAGWASAEA